MYEYYAVGGFVLLLAIGIPIFVVGKFSHHCDDEYDGEDYGDHR